MNLTFACLVITPDDYASNHCIPTTATSSVRRLTKKVNQTVCICGARVACQHCVIESKISLFALEKEFYTLIGGKELNS